MESWSYVSQGNKGFIFDETVSPPDFLAKRKNEFMGWGLNSPFSYGSELLVPSEQINESQGFEELGFQGLMPKQFQEDPIRDVTTPNAFSGEDDSCSKLSNSVVESSGRVSSFIDLKLGSSSSFKSPPVLCSAESISPAKRARGASFNSQTPFCQVHGCDKDLSSSKDYHKRHRVCKDHSKTPKVIVNGIEQRFCQQCSRFHLLAEFDDGKRSCRKRLACHNERRRKPQVGISSRSGRLLQSYDGNRFHGVPTSFICQDILPAALLHPEKFEPNNWCGRIGNSPRSAITTSNAYLHPKPLFPSFDFEKQNPFFHDHDINTATGSYPKSVPRSLFQNTSFGSEDFAVFDTTSSFQGLPGMPDSSCALSLLSSQPENTSSHSSGIPLANPIIGSHAQYNVSQVSDRLLGASRASNSFSSSGMSSAEGANFEVADRIFHGLDFLNEKDRYSRQGGATIDLLQLSSQLHRVEHQRHSMQVKRENDASCCL